MPEVKLTSFAKGVQGPEGPEAVVLSHDKDGTPDEVLRVGESAVVSDEVAEALEANPTVNVQKVDGNNSQGSSDSSPSGSASEQTESNVSAGSPPQGVRDTSKSR